MQKIKILQHPLLGQTAHFGFCPPKIGFFRGLGEVPEIFFSLESLYFCELGPHTKKFKSYDTPFWAKRPILAFVRPKSAFLGG